MAYILQFQATDTIANATSLASGATSATITSGIFGTPVGTQLYVVDYDIPGLAEIISATVVGNSMTSIVRGLTGGAPGTTNHAAGAKIGSMVVPQHYSSLLSGTAGFNFDKVRLTKSVDQSAPSGGPTYLTWDVETYDTNNLHSIVSNTDRITIVTPGYYRLTGHWGYQQPSSTATITSALQKNGTTVINHYIIPASTTTGGTIIVSSTILCVAGDYFQVVINQFSGSNFTLLSGINSYFEATMTP